MKGQKFIGSIVDIRIDNIDQGRAKILSYYVGIDDVLYLKVKRLIDGRTILIKKEEIVFPAKREIKQGDAILVKA